jgi:predicted permease
MAVKEKYLDYLQAVITRHNTNSFMIKGWTITICTAVFTIAGTWKEPILALVALVPTTALWILDSLYLANERCFVSLYTAAINNYTLKVKNKVLLKKYQVLEDGKINPDTEVEIKSAEYSMYYKPFRQIARNNWKVVILSWSIIWYYLMLTGFSIALFIGLLCLNKSISDKPIKVSATIQSDSLMIRTEQPNTFINNIIINDSLIKKDSIKK